MILLLVGVTLIKLAADPLTGETVIYFLTVSDVGFNVRIVYWIKSVSKSPSNLP